MTPELVALLERAGELQPRERAMISVLGEADPDMLTLAQIADVTGAHVHGFGSAMASLCARRFVGRIDTRPAYPGARPAPLYRILPRGRAAYLELQDLKLRQARSRQALRKIGAAA